MSGPNTQKKPQIERITLSHRFSNWLQAHLFGVLIVGVFGVFLALDWFVLHAERGAPGGNILTYGDAVWWGIVTFLTVGYGDKYPVTVEGRMFAAALMIAGVVSMGIMTAKISTFFLEQALKKGRLIMDTEKLNQHFIVCGWKEDMHELLMHILDFNPGLSADKLVMIAAITEKNVDEIRAHPRLKKLQVVLGNYFEDANLKKAAPDRAKKILILADRSKNSAGQVASPTEVDARTIITAMTLSHIARGTLITAEILDPKMDHYLKLASVSEIIYSREYSRLLIGNASGGTGVSNIIFDLLDPRHPTTIMTHPIEEGQIQRSYSEFKSFYEAKHFKSVVIGILENTGNRYSIKELALRQAQKTSDMNRLVDNLKSLKDLKCNHPVFNPADDYVVPEGAMVIVIESRETEASRHAGAREIAA